MTEYKVIGAGSSSDNPIIGNLGCESSTTICWIGRTIYNDGCRERFIDDMYCSAVTEDKEDVKWNELDVHYNLIEDCPQPSSRECSVFCSELTAYPVPLYVPENYEHDIIIYYSYVKTCKDDYENIISRDTISSTVAVPLTSFVDNQYTLDIENGCTSTTVSIKPVELSCDCIVLDGCNIEVETSFNPKEVPSTGATVSITFKYKVVGECGIESGSFEREWYVNCVFPCKCLVISSNESSESEEIGQMGNCCEDHYVSGSITLADFKEKIGVSNNNVNVYYNGEIVTDKIEYSILQRGRKSDECV